MHPPIDRTGLRYGRLLVLRKAGKNHFGRTIWLCQCDCGKQVPIPSQNLSPTKGVRSCGCSKLTNGRKKGTTFKKRITDTGNARYKSMNHPSLHGVPPLDQESYLLLLDDPRSPEEEARMNEVVERMKRAIRQAKGEWPAESK